MTDRDHPRRIGIATSNGATSVAYSPDGRTVASVSGDTFLRLWDVGNPSNPRPLATPPRSTDLGRGGLQPDGRMVAAVGGDHTVRLVGCATQHSREAAILTEHTNVVYSLAFSPDGRTLNQRWRRLHRPLWNVGDPGHPTDARTYRGEIDRVAFSPDGHRVATASGESTVRFWDTDIEHVAARACEVARPPSHRPSGTTTSPASPTSHRADEDWSNPLITKWPPTVAHRALGVHTLLPVTTNCDH